MADTAITLLSNNDCLSQHISRKVHIKTNAIDEKITQHIEELRQLLHEEVLYIECKSWCCDDQLHRFLLARNYRVHDSFELLMSALKWRMTRIPSKGIIELSGDIDWEHKMSREGKTGKIFVAERFDKWERPIVVMDSNVQNTLNADDQLTFLAWNLDLACSLMGPNVDKYVIWINLDNFSIFNSPSMSSSTETIFALTKAYPERLGHLIVYKPTMFLYTVFSAIKYLLDAKTLSKVLFISGIYLILSLYILPFIHIINIHLQFLCD